MRKLPVYGVLSHALRSVIDHLRFAWHVSWPWLLITIPLSLLLETTLPPIDPEAKDAVALARNAQVGSTYMLMGLASMLVFSSIAVNWHRYILKDELPIGRARLRLDGVVWRYFGNTLLVILIVLAACVPIVILLSLLTGVSGLGIGAASTLTMALTGLIAIPLSYRLMVKLPAIAVGNDSFKFKMAMEKTAGNSLQLCIAGVFILVTALLIGLAIGYASTLAGGGAGYVVASVVQQIVSWIVTIYTVTYLTSLYGFFVEGRDF